MVFFLLFLIEARSARYTGYSTSGEECLTQADESHHATLCSSKYYSGFNHTDVDHADPSSGIGVLEADEHQFRRDVLDGTVYDKLMVECGYTDRRTFKGDFFEQVLYGDPTKYYSYNGQVTAAFTARYPNVWQFIRSVKSGGKDAYKRLPQEMQRRESRFLIGRVCGRLAAHHADVPVVTIHDSVLTPQTYQELVTRIVLEEFDRLGVVPALHLAKAKREEEN